MPRVFDLEVPHDKSDDDCCNNRQDNIPPRLAHSILLLDVVDERALSSIAEEEPAERQGKDAENDEIESDSHVATSRIPPFAPECFLQLTA